MFLVVLFRNFHRIQTLHDRRGHPTVLNDIGVHSP